MTRTAGLIEVDLARLVQELDWYFEAQEREGNGRDATLERVAKDAGTSPRNLRRILADGQHCSTDLADRILLAIGYRDGPRRHPTRGHMLPLVIRSRYAVDGRRRQPGEGRFKKVDFANAKLTEKQLRAIHKLHIYGGMSLRAICRQGWEQWGYANEKSALNSISDRLNSIGLKPRGRIEATILASTTHGRGSRADTAAYKRWHRRAFGPWPSDGTDEERQARFAMLRANHSRERVAA